jgi:hypothetical protein
LGSAHGSAVNIQYIQKVWFGDVYYGDTDLHRHYHTVELPQVDVDAQIWLTILSPGANLDQGVTGLAAAGIKSYSYVDAVGRPLYVEPDGWQSHLRVEQCTGITFAFHVQLAWAKAEGIIYWH